MYKPPVANPTALTTILQMVTRADPDWGRRKHHEVEYRWPTGRVHCADPYQRGAFNNRSNVYPVGQPYGGLDAEVMAAKEPTVGNEVPGLYEGVPDGKGWG